jgi:UDP-N-acetylmuramoylalanine--D-glutamate ligase
MMNYQGKQALVLGLGESGLAMALWLARCGAAVRVADTRAAPDRLPALREQAPDAAFIGGAFTETLLDGVDFIAVSPGLAPARELAPIEAPAAARGIPVLGEIELFAQALASLREERGYAPKVLAVTGTNGKTTVTSLTGMLAERAGLSAQVAGNISPAALDMLRQRLDADKLPQLWVLELSSFQLHATRSLRPDAATVLNVTQDHLDWHGDMASYAADKARIFGAGTVRILNRDDALVMAMAAPGAPLLTFGSDEATAPGAFGLAQENGMLWLTEAVPAEDGERKRRKKDDSAAPALPASAARIVPASRPISSTARAWRATGAASGLKSCPLPSPPAISISCGARRPAPRPLSAATVAPTLVPLLSS